MRRKLVVGNWKMNGTRAANAQLLEDIKKAAPFAAEVAVCVPFPYLGEVGHILKGSTLVWGAQNVSAHESGAHTGEVSVSMLAEFDCRFVIVGHSERRAMHGDSDAVVADKARVVLAQGMTPIVCVGETLQEHDAGRTEQVVRRQLGAVIDALKSDTARIVLAYEPVWAIGTGKTATPDQAQAVHAVLRAQLKALSDDAAKVQILYGGSVKADNAASLFSQVDIDGGLIGGASLKASDFVAICRAAN